MLWRQDEEQLTADFAVFVRIPKTGSTSLWWFMNDYSNLENFREYFKSFKGISDRQLKLFSCMFGPPTHSDDSLDSGDSGQCLHMVYGRLRAIWNTASHIWMEQEFARTNVDNIRVTMETFTMVRDPFDRLRSLFDYIYDRSDDGTWEEENTKAQYARVLDGDFAGWMELIFLEDSIPLDPQYTYIDEDVDKAIELITGNSPNVTILVNECFEASLRLLAQKVSLQPGSVEEFIQSDDFQTNISERNNVTQATMAELRERSKNHLPNEYKFYNAAVEQFKRQLPSLDSSVLRHRCDL